MAHLESREKKWEYLNDSLLFHIFSFLPATDVILVGKVCKSWNNIAVDEILWKSLLYRDWKIGGRVPPAPEKESWKLEYKRLKHHTPVVLSETLTAHSGKVLHVVFSNDGKMFASSSVDGSVKIWNATYPATVHYDIDMKRECPWTHAYFTQFNGDNTRLLVSSVYHIGIMPVGEIMVFDVVRKELVFRANNPSVSVASIWYNNTCILSQDTAHRLRGAISVIKIHDLSVETVPSFEACHFLHNRNGIEYAIRNMMVANCSSVTDDKYLIIFIAGSEIQVPHQLAIKKISYSAEREGSRRLDTEIFAEHFLDLRGEVLGATLSPEERFVYINICPLPENYVFDQFSSLPPTTKLMEVRVIDLLTFKEVETATPISQKPLSTCFLHRIGLDISEACVASGSGSDHGFIWEKKYGVCLKKLPHNGKVNSVAFNPMDSETLITASFDSTLKIWISRNRREETEAGTA